MNDTVYTRRLQGEFQMFYSPRRMSGERWSIEISNQRHRQLPKLLKNTRNSSICGIENKALGLRMLSTRGLARQGPKLPIWNKLASPHGAIFKAAWRAPDSLHRFLKGKSRWRSAEPA